MLVSAHPGAAVGSTSSSAGLHRYRPADGGRDELGLTTEEISAVAERAHAPGLIVTLRRGYALFDPEATGDAPRYLHRPEAEPPGNRFNDGKCDAVRPLLGRHDGLCVRGAHRRALLLRRRRQAACGTTLGYAVTNGPTWSRDGRTMYFNDTVRGPRQCLRLRAGDGRTVESARMAAVRAPATVCRTA